MLKNYFIIAIRSFWRDKVFSVINFAGLVIGLATVLLITAYVRYELSYDRHYSNSGNIYRIIQKTKAGTGEVLNIQVNSGTAVALKNELPEVEAFSYVSKGDEQFKIKNEFITINTIDASADFFRLFDFPFITGNSQTSLQQKRNMVITERTAKTFFPGINPIGKSITDNYGDLYSITGIIKDIPSNTHLQFDAVVSVEGQNFTKNKGDRRKGSLNFPQYLLLKAGTDPEAVMQKLSPVYKKYHFNPEQTLQLQPITSIRLHSNLPDELYPNSDIKYIYIFSSAGFLILLIAVINYINLNIARSLKRTREVGVRKLAGASRKQLIYQFLCESFLFFLTALIMALVFAYAVWPYFAIKITNTNIPLPLLDLQSLWILSSVSIVGGLISGIYPALFLSQLRPALSLKGILKHNVNFNLRRALVVFQFVISGALIIATLVVQQQMYFINNSRLGFNKENLISIPYDFFKNDPSIFKNELQSNPDITAVSISKWEPGKKFIGSNIIPEKENKNRIDVQFITSDLDLIKTAGFELIKGRDFSEKYGNDILNLDTVLYGNIGPHQKFNNPEMRSIILNETAVKLLDLKDPVGKTYNNINIKGTVIGIVKDFNASTLHQTIPAIELFGTPYERNGNLFIRISSRNMQETLSFIENKWKQFYPDNNFEFSFVDEKIQKLYSSEQKLGAFFGIFASLGIFIACLGLFGLVSLTVQQRVKEIGVRKVLGATVPSIINLLSVDLLKLVLLAIAIASPISWWAMNIWLQDFAYRIHIGWWVFALAALLSVLLAFITISLLSIKAAKANPINNLRTE